MNKKLLAFIASVWALSFLAGVVYAQESDEDVAAKYGITFPIAELGECTSISDCRTFCEDPVNYSVCIDFAKSKGFYDEEEAAKVKEEEILASARQELGCNSYQSCKTFCNTPSNFERCDAFAKSYALSGGHVRNPEEEKFLSKAREVLGCDTASSCMNFCSREENWQRCSDFAKQVGLAGGERQVGPGGCTSFESCKKFCSTPDNYQVCSGFSSAAGGKFSGPGGCDSEESCRSYCEKNPNECGIKDEYLGGDPQDYCEKTPNCSWGGSTCNCTYSGGQYYSGEGSYDPKSECSKYPGCTWTGSSCQCQEKQTYPTGQGEGSYDPATECAKQAGCSWTGSTCSCSGGGDSSQEGSYDPSTECTKQSGCSWTGSTCQCSDASSGGSSSTGDSQESSSDDYASQCSSQGCNWTGSTCECPTQVYGTSTVVNWFNRLLQFILSK